MREQEEPADDRLNDDDVAPLRTLEPAWLRATLHSIGDGVIATDKESRIIFANPAAERLTGWSQQDSIGQPIGEVFRIVDEETGEPVENPLHRAIREGEISRLTNHTVLITRNGAERAISDSAAPIMEDGRPVGAVLVFRDVSQRREAEIARDEALGYAKSIIAALHHPFLVLDPELCVRSANERFYETFEVSPQDIEGRQVYALGNGQWDIPELRGMLKGVLEGDSAFEEFAVSHDFPAIGHRHMLLNARRMQRDNGVDLILLGIEDVTERHELEQERGELETRFTNLVKNIRDHAIFTVDLDGRITTWNDEAERILGYRKDEAIGEHFALIFTEEDVEAGAHQQELDLAARHGRAEDERWHRRKNGERFWALGIVTPMRDSDGNHNGYSKILRDMTDRKRDEMALREADQRKNEFLAMLSHELRNPLSPVLNAVQLLGQNRSEIDNERARGIIERQVRHMKRLIDDLLEVSRISSGRIQLKTERVRLMPILHSSIERARPKLEQCEQRLAVDASEEPIWLDADAARLEQVIDNLLTNASKFSDRGTTIELRVALEADDVLICIRDCGVGIDPDLLPDVFELFTQADRSLHRTQGGLGIGLALARKLVELHGGSITAHSEGADLGSEFRIRLPVTESGSDVVAPQVPRRTIASDSINVLVVDDHVDGAEVSAMLLQAWGHRAVTAHSGTDALTLAERERPELILLDIGLPDIDGYELARRIRGDDRYGAPILVAVTGYGQASDRQRSHEAGFDAHLVKPVESAELEQVLREIRSR